MRIVFGIVVVALMGCVFTLITAVMWATQHLFASLGVMAAAAVSGAVCRRRNTRRSRQGLGYRASRGHPQPVAVSWSTAAQMSSAIAPRRCLP
jgi:hypothetical protein